MSTQVMLDLETFGTKPGSAIVSIGAVKFNDNEILDSFYERVDINSCITWGMTVDMSTILWWMGQPDEPRKEIIQAGKPIGEVLFLFSRFVNDENAEIWGNGSNFDNVLLSEAYRLNRITRPWGYQGDRCYRTLKNLYKDIKVDREGTLHNALEDAKYQAKHLMKILEKIRENNA